MSPHPLRLSLTLTLGLLGAACVSAAPTTVYEGRLDDPANTALVGSDLGAPSFVDALAIANNVALYTVLVAVPGTVTLTSTGFAAGGVDPYVTLFEGAGTAGAALLSNAASAFSTGGDFTLSFGLAAGSYRLAVGTFANQSFAENLGSGTLADGFTGLGVPAWLGDGSYRLEVTTPVPEPASAALMALGLTVLLSTARRRSR